MGIDRIAQDRHSGHLRELSQLVILLILLCVTLLARIVSNQATQPQAGRGCAARKVQTRQRPGVGGLPNCLPCLPALAAYLHACLSVSLTAGQGIPFLSIVCRAFCDTYAGK